MMAMLQFQQTICLVLAGLSMMWQAVAQGTSNVSCTAASWTFNEEHQSPCQVAAALEFPCLDEKINIPPLSPNHGYSGAPTGESNKCYCSSVTYSMLSACAACQTGGIIQWNVFIQNCTQNDISISAYPLPIPSGISVPAWAYIDVTVAGVWPMGAAETNQSSGAPDLSAGMPTSTSTTQSSATPTPSASSTPSSTSSSNAGAIAGGVVGGIVGFVAAILLACIFYRRRIRSQRDGQRIEFRRERIDLGESTLPTQMATVLLPTQRPKLYNPSDPSTFPPTPHPSLPSYTVTSHTDSDIISPTGTLSGPFSVASSASYNPTSGNHGRQVSNGTSNASTVTRSAQHGRNYSAETAEESAMRQQKVVYNGIPEL